MPHRCKIGRRTFADAGSLELQSDGIAAGCLFCRVFALLDYTSLMFLCGRRSAASFLGSRLKSQGADHVVVKVTALPAAAPNAALRKEVDAIGEKQTDALHRLFKQVNALHMCSFVLLSCVPLRGQCGSDG